MNDLPLADVVGADCAVPPACGSLRRCINLDNAASTPALQAVLQAVVDFMPWYASVHRGAGYKSQLATQRFEQARATIAAFFAADARDQVIFGKNSTEAINKLSYRLALAPHDLVLVSQLEHHSNDLPWRARARVMRIRADANGALDEEHAAHLLRQHAGRVRLLAVTGGSNVTGHMPRVHRLAALAHAAGARILVDAAQLAAHRRVVMGALDDPQHIDYLALSGHKMYAPFGVGALIGRRDTFEQGEPEMRGGGTIRFVSDDAVAWAAAPDRDEAGSPNVVGAIALAAAMDELERLGMDAIAAHEARLVARALQGLAGVPGLQLYGDADPRRAAQRLGVIPFNLQPLSHALLAAALSAEHGIGVRNGCFCAHPYVTHLLRLSADEARRVQAQLARDDLRDVPGLVRISFGLYNTMADVDQLLAALRAMAQGLRREDDVQDIFGQHPQPRTGRSVRAGRSAGPLKDMSLSIYRSGTSKR
jgi:cysteine desulfurase / selenocysteine lyase